MNREKQSFEEPSGLDLHGAQAVLHPTSNQEPLALFLNKKPAKTGFLLATQ